MSERIKKRKEVHIKYIRSSHRVFKLNYFLNKKRKRKHLLSKLIVLFSVKA